MGNKASGLKSEPLPTGRWKRRIVLAQSSGQLDSLTTVRSDSIPVIIKRAA